MPLQPPPLQPPNVDPASATAVNVTTVPDAYEAEQLAPQLIPDGELYTAPDPLPAFDTVSVCVLAKLPAWMNGGIELGVTRVRDRELHVIGLTGVHRRRAG